MSNKTKTSSLFIYLFLQKHILLPKKDTGTQIFVAEIIIQIHTRSTVIYFFFTQNTNLKWNSITYRVRG